ncbi:MAG: cell division protein FtsZ [Leptospiraceae bacterium]|nr:cell division protein FtsZ [Leptospiraceae bacterium]MDW8305544.1 cell division protein FtsZ [Leptospiraceae bacterium]
MLNFAEEEKSPAIIKVVGVGGAGMNAVERMCHLRLQGVELIAMNTDEQVLRRSSAHQKVHLGTKLTRGMGAGAKPEIGAQAAMEDREKIMNVLKGADMVFITAGMGGGTGTGAAPIVADVARELKALTVGVITLPFKAEGQKKMEIARAGQANMREKVDTLITIPNDAIFKIIDKTTPVKVAFKHIDDILARAVMGISDIINSTGVVNVDFADVKTVMSNNGDAVIGLGEGSGENRVQEAIQNAIHHPLLDGRSIDGASAVLINVVASEDISMYEYYEIQEKIHEMVSPDATIIVGFTEDSSKVDKLAVTVIATGFRKIQNAKSNAPEKEKKEEDSKVVHNITPLRRNGTENTPMFPGMQQGLKFPNIEPSIESLDIPTFLRRKK